MMSLIPDWRFPLPAKQTSHRGNPVMPAPESHVIQGNRPAPPASGPHHVAPLRFQRLGAFAAVKNFHLPSLAGFIAGVVAQVRRGGGVSSDGPPVSPHRPALPVADELVFSG